MLYEEYEALKLADYNLLTQEEAAEKMQERAVKKIAQMKQKLNATQAYIRLCYESIEAGHPNPGDIALLKVEPEQPLPYVQFGDSDIARVGDWVLAIGNPLGFGHTVTQGIVSALGRWGLLPNAPYEDYIQTDATIHQGNSGGALIDVRGHLLGINTLIYTGTSEVSRGSNTGIGISLAIPVNLAAFVMRDLIDYGEVIRGWLGVSVDPVVSAVEGSSGQALLVVAVAQDSPAARAGIQVGDVITHIDGEVVEDGRLTMHRIAQLRPGEPVRVRAAMKPISSLNRALSTVDVVTGELQDVVDLPNGLTGGASAVAHPRMSSRKVPSSLRTCPISRAAHCLGCPSSSVAGGWPQSSPALITASWGPDSWVTA